ncbi:hypothetical protein ACG2F4_14930 [Halalkalibaculum sp. DA3122]|uniref:hypothetical protein n=1 Tax=Halalkalibaculum sp. DA3122 TaxID=3373607 RepID=UPI0037552BDC
MNKQSLTQILKKYQMNRINNISKKIVSTFKYGHDAHRLSLGLIFIWFGLLKPFGAKTATSLLAHTIYFFPPETVLPMLGWWEVAIGITLIFKPWVKYSIILQFIRIPGTILAFFIHPDVCFVQIPFVPSPEGQYLIKDLIILFAGIAIAETVHENQVSS